MNILRLSTLSLTLAMAVMTLGYVNPSFADKPVNDKHDHGGGDDGDVAMYSVTITGDVEGKSDDKWHWRGDFGGKKTIGLNDAVIGTMVGEFTGLNVFTDVKSPLVDAAGVAVGAECFPLNKQKKLVPLTLHQASVSQGKQGRAEAGFFFDGWTHKKVDGQKVQVVATLKLIGTFMTGETWPPPSGSSSTLEITDWELSVTNEGKDIKSISCIGKGKFMDFLGTVGMTNITVTKEN